MILEGVNSGNSCTWENTTPEFLYDVPSVSPAPADEEHSPDASDEDDDSNELNYHGGTTVRTHLLYPEPLRVSSL